MSHTHDSKPAAHTKGPWRIKPGKLYANEVVGLTPRGHDRCVARVSGATERDANARLIAAAPELLDALRDLVLRCDGMNVDAARAVLAKVRWGSDAAGAK